MKRILLIGDDPNVCRAVSGTLAGLGFGVDVAYDSRTGMFLADRRDYSHVVVDHDIDDSGGIRLFERLSDFQQDVTGILLTAADNLNTVVQALNAGMRRVLAKPVDYGQLLQVLNGAVAFRTTVPTKRHSEEWIAQLSQHDIRESLTVDELISVIRSVDYPFAGKDRLEHFDRDTLERVVHLVCRWCRQRSASTKPATMAQIPVASL